MYFVNTRFSLCITISLKIMINLYNIRAVLWLTWLCPKLEFFSKILPLLFCLQEPDTEICASMLDSLNECLQVRITR